MVNRPAKDGWYAIDLEGELIVTKSNAENRHNIALADANDCGAKFTGYWNGVAWEDIELVSKWSGRSNKRR